jgi:GT2 family glycosyltransferase
LPEVRGVISFVLPTRDRPDSLAGTLRSLGSLDRGRFEPAGGAEVIVVDNGGGADAPASLENGFPVRLMRADANLGTAARNDGAQAAAGDWLVMLDDDSSPVDAGLVDVSMDAPSDVAAIGAEIFLPSVRRADGTLAGRPRREAGGLPEVFVGCGVLIRREAFLGVGGYDRAFGYYAEEYDLCAKLLLGGWRVTHDRRFRVDHHKVEAGRDMNRIVRMLARNGGWVAARYAPDAERAAAVRRVLDRCALIAENEGAREGFSMGCAELERTIDAQTRTPMTADLYDRFTGLAAARYAIRRHRDNGSLGDLARLVHPGKHAWCVREALTESGVELVDDDRGSVAGDIACVVGTLSPGPMWDAVDSGVVSGDGLLAPWIAEEPGVSCPPARGC